MGWPVRYRIVGLIFLLALINHIDRANISIAAPDMISALGWDEAQYCSTDQMGNGQDFVQQDRGDANGHDRDQIDKDPGSA